MLLCFFLPIRFYMTNQTLHEFLVISAGAGESVQPCPPQKSFSKHIHTALQGYHYNSISDSTLISLISILYTQHNGRGPSEEAHSVL